MKSVSQFCSNIVWIGDAISVQIDIDETCQSEHGCTGGSRIQDGLVLLGHDAAPGSS